MEARSRRRQWTRAAGLVLAGALVARPATGAPGDEAERLVKAAGAYIAVWDVDGRAACEARRPACEHMEEMLDRAARALQGAHRTGAAILVLQTLLDPRYHLDNTDRARMAPYEMGLAYQAIGAYAEAATLFERFTEEREALDQAPPALEEAARLRLRLGQRDKAIADAALFQRLYARKHPERSSRITLAIAARDEQEEDFAASISLLTAAMPAIDRAAPLETRIEAHVRMGRALSAMGRVQGAATEMSRVLVIARDRAAAAALKRRGKEEAKDAATEDAIAEARFFQGEQKREEVLRIKLAPYRGGGDRASVLAYLNNPARAYVTQKEYTIRETERAYLRVYGIEVPPTAPPPPPPPPSPPGVIGLINSGGGDPNAPIAFKDDPFSTSWPGSPPSFRWAIAAAARVGAMWGDFVREIRSMPIPREWSSPLAGDFRGTYYQILDSMDELYKQRARAAFKTCLRYSVESQRFDDFSRSCEAWLAKNYGAEYHTVDELVSGPRWLHPGLVAEPAPAPAAPRR